MYQVNKSDTELNPMEGSGPLIHINDDYDEGMFTSLDPQNHPYRMDDECIMTQYRIAAWRRHFKYRILECLPVQVLLEY